MPSTIISAQIARPPADASNGEGGSNLWHFGGAIRERGHAGIFHSQKGASGMQRFWPADAVERRPVASLLPYARNARTHSADQVAQIAAAIREWGWTVPVLVDEAGQ